MRTWLSNSRNYDNIYNQRMEGQVACAEPSCRFLFVFMPNFIIKKIEEGPVPSSSSIYIADPSSYFVHNTFFALEPLHHLKIFVLFFIYGHKFDCLFFFFFIFTFKYSFFFFSPFQYVLCIDCKSMHVHAFFLSLNIPIYIIIVEV